MLLMAASVQALRPDGPLRTHLPSYAIALLLHLFSYSLALRVCGHKPVEPGDLCLDVIELRARRGKDCAAVQAQ